MKRYLQALCGAFFLACLPALTSAQGIPSVRVVTACGAVTPFPAFAAGDYGFILVDANGNLCTNVGSGGAAPVQVAIVPARAPLSHDGSGTIAAGGTWQQVIAANPNRLRLFVQNYCTSTSQGVAAAESLFVTISTTQPASTVGAIELEACGSYESSDVTISTENVWVMTATTAHAFAAKEW